MICNSQKTKLKTSTAARKNLQNNLTVQKTAEEQCFVSNKQERHQKMIKLKILITIVKFFS